MVAQEVVGGCARRLIKSLDFDLEEAAALATSFVFGSHAHSAVIDVVDGARSRQLIAIG